MESGDRMTDEVKERLRSIPPVNDLLAEWPVIKAAGEAGDAIARAALNDELAHERSRIMGGAEPRGKRDLALAVSERAHRDARPSLRPVVNATGVVVHTNLGRAPLAPSAVAAVDAVARGYSTLEYSVDTCSRGSRSNHAMRLIRTLTGAEGALVVNNNAAAVLLVLAALAPGREVIVSRGELVEIGGSFRVPDIIAASGATLVEVGSTNRTRLSDYERAITRDTAMLLKVHPSNYRIEGFHEEVDPPQLARLAHDHGLVLFEDLGSGALVEMDILKEGGELTARESLASGADLISCSGDKLLGASQAGIIFGRSNLIERCAGHPMMRALRPDKMTLAALEATLRLYVSGQEPPTRSVPVLNMLTCPVKQLERRATDLAQRIRTLLEKAGCPDALRVEVVEGTSMPGGGALPTVELPTFCVAVTAADQRLAADGLKRALVQEGDTPVVTRIAHDRLLFDVRTMIGTDDLAIAAEALARCVRRRLSR